MGKYLDNKEHQVVSTQSKLIQKVSLDRYSDLAIEEKKEMHNHQHQNIKSRIFGVYNKKTSTFYYIDIQEYLSLRKLIKCSKK